MKSREDLGDVPWVWGSSGFCWLLAVYETLQEERRCAMHGTRSGRSTYNPPLRSPRSLSAQSNTPSQTTPKRPGGEATVGCGGPCSSRGGSLVEGAEARGKASAGSWRCQQGWLQLEGPSWRGGLAEGLSRSTSPKQSEWPAQQRNTWKMQRYETLVQRKILKKCHFYSTLLLLHIKRMDVNICSIFIKLISFLFFPFRPHEGCFIWTWTLKKTCTNKHTNIKCVWGREIAPGKKAGKARYLCIKSRGSRVGDGGPR